MPSIYALRGRKKRTAEKYFGYPFPQLQVKAQNK